MVAAGAGASRPRRPDKSQTTFADFTDRMAAGINVTIKEAMGRMLESASKTRGYFGSDRFLAERIVDVVDVFLREVTPVRSIAHDLLTVDGERAETYIIGTVRGHPDIEATLCVGISTRDEGTCAPIFFIGLKKGGTDAAAVLGAETDFPLPNKEYDVRISKMPKHDRQGYVLVHRKGINFHFKSPMGRDLENAAHALIEGILGETSPDEAAIDAVRD